MHDKQTECKNSNSITQSHSVTVIQNYSITISQQHEVF